MAYGETRLDYLVVKRDDLFQQLLELTKAFPFKPDAEGREISQEACLKEIMSYVRYIAIKLYRQIPAEVRVSESQEDWIQYAFLILFTATLEYDPARSYYDVHIKGRVYRRLQDKQRSAYRGNPGKMYVEWSEEKVFSVFETDDDGAPRFSPDKAYMTKEARMILLECLGRLKPYRRGIVIERYLEEKKYEDIASKRGVSGEAVRSHARMGFQAMRDCVTARYAEGSGRRGVTR